MSATESPTIKIDFGFGVVVVGAGLELVVPWPVIVDPGEVVCGPGRVDDVVSRELGPDVDESGTVEAPTDDGEAGVVSPVCACGIEVERKGNVVLNTPSLGV